MDILGWNILTPEGAITLGITMQLRLLLCDCGALARVRMPCGGFVPDQMSKWTSSLGSQPQPERGSRLPLGYCGWSPSSRDFGALSDTSRVCDSWFYRMDTAQSAVCVCKWVYPVGWFAFYSALKYLTCEVHCQCRTSVGHFQTALSLFLCCHFTAAPRWLLFSSLSALSLSMEVVPRSGPGRRSPGFLLAFGPSEAQS